MTTAFVKNNPRIVQKLVNAYVETLKWIQGHSAAQIADQMPAAYYAGIGKASYVSALAAEKGIYNPTGIMPPNGPPTNLRVLSTFNPAVKGKKIVLSQTYTDEFVNAVK